MPMDTGADPADGHGAHGAVQPHHDHSRREDPVVRPREIRDSVRKRDDGGVPLRQRRALNERPRHRVDDQQFGLRGAEREHE